MGVDVAKRAARDRRKRGSLPWIEAPEKVFSSIKAFLDGAWPEAAHRVELLDPKDGPEEKQ